MGNFGLFGDAPGIDTTGFNAGLGQANASAGAQGNAAGMAALAARGQGPTAADATMRAGLLQAQRTSAASAASTRGNFGLAGAQRTAQTTQAGMSQDAIGRGAALRATEQQQGLAQYIQATQAQRSQDLQAAGLSAQEAEAQAQLEAQQNMANQQTSGNVLGGIMGTVGGLATGAMMLSDEQAKTEIQGPFYQPTSAGGAGLSPPDQGPSGMQRFAKGMGGSMSDAWKGLSQEQIGGGGYTPPTPQEMLSTSDEHAKLEAERTGYANGMAAMLDRLPGYAPPAASIKDMRPPPGPATMLHQGHLVDSDALDQDPRSPPRSSLNRVGGGTITLDERGHGVQDRHDETGPFQGGPGNWHAPPRQAAPAGGTGSQAAEQFLQTLQPHAFSWKDPASAPNPQAAGTPNLGVFAQEVEQSPWGHAIVQQEPGGYKQLDVKALTSALAAGAGQLKQRTDQHEQRLAALEAMATGGR